MAVDEQYAAPLFVTVLSLLENLRAAVGRNSDVMSIGFTPETRRKLDRAWGDRVRIHWVATDYEKVETLRSYGYMASPAANFRLVVGSSLPGDVSKVIYLDADLLIGKDILELWQRAMHGKIVLAVQDSYLQRFPAGCLPAEEQGQSEAPYFNSGVMVIDLAAWRAAGSSSAASKLRADCSIEPSGSTNTSSTSASPAAGDRCRRSGTSSSRSTSFRIGGAVPMKRRSSRKRAATRRSFTSVPEPSRGIRSPIIRRTTCGRTAPPSGQRRSAASRQRRHRAFADPSRSSLLPIADSSDLAAAASEPAGASMRCARCCRRWRRWRFGIPGRS